MLYSYNPSTDELLAEFPEDTNEQVLQKIDQSAIAYRHWKNVSVSERCLLFVKLAEILRSQKEDLARLISLEMGRIFRDSIAEIEKCAWACEWYAQNSEKTLQDEHIVTEAKQSFVQYDSLGIIFSVMPWNFPFWQMIRVAAPTMIAGNTMLMKHASNVPQCSLALHRIFLEAGFPVGAFQSLMIGSAAVERVIADQRVRGVTLTGSENAGRKVAVLAGHHLKKSVLELGGNNPYIICDDADITAAVPHCVSGRFQNCGQSCLAGKRFLVTQKNADQFIALFTEATKKIRVGDAFDSEAMMGPVVSKKARDELHHQVQKTIEMGGTLLCGGEFLFDHGSFYAPTLISGVKKGMPLYHEEAFGPVGSIIICQDEQEMITVANDSDFGLGVAVFTNSKNTMQTMIAQLETPSVHFNGIVKSDPRLPFGGIKNSGYGRECSLDALKEFVNVKTIVENDWLGTV